MKEKRPRVLLGYVRTVLAGDLVVHPGKRAPGREPDQCWNLRDLAEPEVHDWQFRQANLRTDVLVRQVFPRGRPHKVKREREWLGTVAGVEPDPETALAPVPRAREHPVGHIPFRAPARLRHVRVKR